MATLTTALQNAIANAIDDAVNTGSGTAQFILETSGDAEVAAFDLQNPAFGAASSGLITAAGVPIQDADAAGGTIAQASLYDRDGAKLLESVAATSGQEVTVSSTTVAADEVVTLTALTIQVPAS
jgi:hypothetical protein